MARTRDKQQGIREGDWVIWYDRGRVAFNTGRPVLVRKLYLQTRKQVQLADVMGMYREIDNCWHVSCQDDPVCCNEESLRRAGLWATIEEHDALYEAELDRLERRREQQDIAAEQKKDLEDRRANALRALRRGENLDDVAKASGIPAAELNLLVETGV